LSRFFVTVRLVKANLINRKQQPAMTSRRQFITNISIISAAAYAATAGRANAQAAVLTEADPQATALGYKTDSTKVDKAKYPKHEVSQKCANCSLYQGKATDPQAPCAIFAGKLVAGPGWCSAWVKKAA
jgi:High potential iron-sulfur protein